MMNFQSSGDKAASASAGSYCGNTPAREQTIGESLDEAIASARRQLEHLCVLKAKTEAVQMLNTPVNFVRSLAYPGNVF